MTAPVFTDDDWRRAKKAARSQAVRTAPGPRKLPTEDVIAATRRAERTYGRAEEVLELVELAHRRTTGRRHRRDLYQHCLDVYLELMKWDKGGGHGMITWGQLQRQLYDDEASTADPHAKSRSLRRWLNLLEEAGLILWGPRTLAGSRKWAGLSYTLLAVPELHSGTARGYSSVGDAVRPCGARRRRESAEERDARRVAPYRRRGGRAGVARWVVPDDPRESRPLFFGAAKVPPLEPIRVPTGPDGQRRRGRRADAREAWTPPAGAASKPADLDLPADAIEAACPPQRRAALRALRTAALTGGIDVCRAASAAGVETLVVILVAWAIVLPGLEPRLSRRWRDQLERSEWQYDRLAGEGAAAAFLLDRIEQIDVDYRQGLDPRTLAFYIADLKAAARALRRHRRGMPPPRPHRARGQA